MPPTSSLAALLSSPSGENDSTDHPSGQTLPDISLDSLGSSFRSEDSQAEPSKQTRQRIPTSSGPSLFTPSPPHVPNSALLSLSPPTTVRRTSSHSALPDQTPGTAAPRRNRILSRSSASSASSASETDGPLRDRYGSEDDDNVLSQLSVNISPKRRQNGVGWMGGVTPRAKQSYHGGPSRRNGRHSVAADVGSGPMTLREQEQQLEAMRKEFFSLQLENHFLKERLASMGPESLTKIAEENAKLKAETLNLSKECKKYKKLVLQLERELAASQRGDGKGSRGGNELKELEGMWKEEKERRRALEKELDEGRAKLEDTEASEVIWRKKAEELEGELEGAKGTLEDQTEEMERVREAADRARDELERMQLEKSELGGSVGLGKGREAKLLQKVADLEKEHAVLQQELEDVRNRGGSADADELEDQINSLRDKLAAAQIDLDRRDQEIEELNAEIEAKIRDHEAEIQQVEADWRDEVIEARAQVDELKDVTNLKELRDALLEREEELAVVSERVAELEAAQSETHDRLEETMRNIERDNEEKEADLIAANKEIEVLGQRVYELEEALDELRVRESDLNADLRSADEAFDSTKSHYETLVAALKEARRKLQDDHDTLISQIRQEEEAHLAEKERWRQDKQDQADSHRRALAEQEKAQKRLRSELDAAKDKVAAKDRDIVSVQSNLRALEDERRRIGDDRTTDRFGMGMEIEKVKRELARAEDELSVAREEVELKEAALRQRDLEVASMMDKQRDLESRLSSERQGRLNMSDRLDHANKTARQLEKEAQQLRERLQELEPLLTETQQERFALQKQAEQQRQERSDLLLRVFKDINKFLGTEDHTTPVNFTAFRDALLQRVRAINQVRSDFEKRIKETETSVDQRMVHLKKQLEQKWRALDNFEAAVKKLELTRMQWRQKYALKEGELDAVKTKNQELLRQLSSPSNLSASPPQTAQLRSLHERCSSAEKRESVAKRQLADLEARVAEMQARAGQAEAKWEARVKEYENRLRIAGEKIKTEKQGGKERAAQLEGQVRELERQLENARRRNQRAEGVVASAAHLMPEYRER
ncbi:hypothetical protein TREMEDRAFT_26645 [Tremella mesenterica DSM 1558]|uniref:uncharacterized protein n=1 Tax=Tremella mesenterica (strain ATCC 24925 / CBS 8224 / DSM 1558 / NBRC 9311 / NRRL Y-6157 / RJB 2259-6 / UBC 559-6) TaxID=578456 RepID=UPI0003F498E3|nr:uncharacterized protein TREMEDRAFT_26645 [Tremella mesenterica DSM 1558]EIW73667.1 hypothetical protein TREMEDRAFT_26645 [Tremella mesenterica DSM 1558]